VNRPWPFRTRGRIVLLVVAIAAVVALAWRMIPARHSTATEIAVDTVARRDISITVEASGAIEPINLVEVKSKASGQIVKMPVEIGSVVKAGDLLVQIDPRDVKNSFDMSQAALVAAEAKAKVSGDQRQRADDLFASQVITATEHETALLDYANAQSALVAARTDLDLARQRLEDATVRAPSAGTILAKPVSVGMVISSATSSASGGTTLLEMAALDLIRMRALVAETDIGKVQIGQSVSVVVDAYPQRTFPGKVDQIEPQAVIQQSVTMFPVLVSISNQEGKLLPGMNGEVTMMVDQRTGVLAVPLDALRSMREINTVAAGLGMPADSLRARIRAAAQAGGALAFRGGPGDSAAGPGRRARGDSAGFGRGNRGGGAGGGPGGAGAGGFDPARAARWRARMAAGGGAGGAGDPAGGGSGNGGGRGPGGGFGGGGGAAGGAGSGGAGMEIAVVKTDHGLEPRPVRIGISDYDYAEVLAGLKEGEQVALLSVLEIQRQRAETATRVRERTGGGITGTTSAPAGGARRGGGN